MTKLSTSSWTSILSENSYYGQYNISGTPPDIDFLDTTVLIIFLCFLLVVLIVAIFGLIGNAIVIWFLSFIIKRNPITTYIFNLALADSGVLITLLSCFLSFVPVFHEWDFHRIILVYFYLSYVFLLLYLCSLHLLTAISIEKCLSVIFPIWHRCHRPKYMSVVACILIWSICGINAYVFFLTTRLVLEAIVFIANVVCCIPVTVISTVTLLIKVHCRFRQRRQGRLYIVTLLTLLVFLVFGAPLSFILMCQTFYSPIEEAFYICILLTSINSSINPLIYFLIGRKKARRSRESIKVVLQRVFSDQPDCRV